MGFRGWERVVNDGARRHGCEGMGRQLVTVLWWIWGGQSIQVRKTLISTTCTFGSVGYFWSWAGKLIDG